MNDTVIQECGDWTLMVRDGNLEARKPVPYDGTLTYTTETREHVSPRKNSQYNLSASEVIEHFEKQTGTDVRLCKMCEEWPAGAEGDATYRDTRFCSAKCDVKYDHLKADARDARATDMEGRR